jgi:hypothetical protein
LTAFGDSLQTQINGIAGLMKPFTIVLKPSDHTDEIEQKRSSSCCVMVSTGDFNLCELTMARLDLIRDETKRDARSPDEMNAV